MSAGLRSVLVTGATGFLGGNLARALVERGARVRVLVRGARRPEALVDLPYESVEGDLCDALSLRLAVDGCQFVYHAAAAITMWCANRAEFERVRAVNAAGTRALLEAAAAARVERVLHVSTVDTIGLPPPGCLAGEETNWPAGRIDTPYAATKREAEQIAREAEVDTVIVNPGFMIGPFDTKPSSGRLLQPLMKGLVVVAPVRGGNNFVDVRAVVDGAIAAMERGVRGERYILGGINLSYREFFARALRILGRRPIMMTLPCGALQAAGRVCDVVGRMSGREPALPSAVARLACADHYYRSDKAIRELAYVPSTSIDQALRDAFDWFGAARKG